jgi:hypothetical protein
LMLESNKPKHYKLSTLVLNISLTDSISKTVNYAIYIRKLSRVATYESKTSDKLLCIPARTAMTNWPRNSISLW